MGERTLIGAGWHFCAAHSSATRPAIHGHSYEVKAWWPYEGQDVEAMQAQLQAALIAFDHKALPADLSRAEDLARAIGALLPGCVRIDLWRPLERLGCEVWL